MRVDFRLLAPVLAVLLIAAAPPAAAAARELEFGISADTRGWGAEAGDEQDNAARTGARRLREDIEWQQVEPSKGSWRWSETDQLFRSAATRGMGILPILNGPPCWAVAGGTDPEDCWRSYPSSDDEYAVFVAAVAARYGPGGAFWIANPSLDASVAPRHFEIWNEPYYPYFTNDEVDPRRYARLYKAAVIAGRAANASTRYLVESTVDVPDPDGSGWVNWAQELVNEEPDIGAFVDGIAIHPYPGSNDPDHEPTSGTDPSFRNTDLIYENWVDLGIDRPIWITEIGYSSCDDGADRCVPGVTQALREQQKANWLTEVFHELGSGNYGFVHAVYLYNLRQWEGSDIPANHFGAFDPFDAFAAIDARDSFDAWLGVLDGDGDPLPAWFAFKDAVDRYDSVGPGE